MSNQFIKILLYPKGTDLLRLCIDFSIFEASDINIRFVYLNSIELRPFSLKEGLYSFSRFSVKSA